MRVLSNACFIGLVGALAVHGAEALEYSGTCRGSSATITMIEGLDTSHAEAVAQVMLPDAIAYCHYSLGKGAGKKRPTDQAVRACAQGFIRDAEKGGPIRASANCQTGSISTSTGKWSNAYKLPLEPMCGDDNNQAISLFKVLCPSYEGKIEASD